jgi:hypothetical protein
VWEQGHRMVAQAPGSGGLVENWRALKSGTAAHATPGVGRAPNLATTPGDGDDAPGRTRARPAAEAGQAAAGRGRHAHRSRPAGDHRTAQRCDP